MTRHPAQRASGIRSLVAAVTLVLALALTGCVALPWTATPEDRPVLSEAVADYDEMLTEMRDLIAERVPGGTWTQVQPAQTGAGDEEVAGEDALIGRSPLWGYDLSLSTLSDDELQSLINDLSAVADKHDFTDLAVFIDRPGETQAASYGPFDAEMRLGSMKNTTVRYITASHPRG